MATLYPVSSVLRTLHGVSLQLQMSSKIWIMSSNLINSKLATTNANPFKDLLREKELILGEASNASSSSGVGRPTLSAWGAELAGAFRVPNALHTAAAGKNFEGVSSVAVADREDEILSSSERSLPSRIRPLQWYSIWFQILQAV